MNDAPEKTTQKTTEKATEEAAEQTSAQAPEAPEQSADAPPVDIDVILDFVCPWSYIGMRRLENTLDMLGRENFRVTYYPFLMAADVPPGGMPRKEWLAKTYGTRTQIEKALEPIRVAGLQDGIAFDFDAIEVMPNTLDAHRLMRWARDAGREREMAERLFSLFFTEGEDIGDIDVLARAAAEVGVMDAFRAQKMLESGTDTEEVWDEIMEVKELGVKRLPAFIIARKYAILGAEDPITLARTLQAVQAGLELEAEEAAKEAGEGRG